MGPPKVPEASPPPIPPSFADPSIEQAAKQARSLATGGLPATIQTGGRGVLGKTNTSAKSKTGE